MELFESVSVGPVEVRRLELTLPNLSFPVDLSGGVPVFRHRRGDLERVELRLSFSELGEWIQPRVREVLGPSPRRPQIWATAEGLGIGLVAGDQAVAFDLVWAPVEGDARWVVAQPRAFGVDGAAMGFALRIVDSILGRWVERRGRVITLARAGLRLGQEILPALGARAPAAGRVRFGALEVLGDELAVNLDATFPPVSLSPSAVQALELAELAGPGDEALVANQLDRARAAYLGALESAPRHPELVRVIAEIDVAVGGRAEAALGMVVESLPAMHMGVVGAELLAAVGDLEGACAALDECARREPFPPLAALFLGRLAALQSGRRECLHWLDQAVARCPGLEAVRLERFNARLCQGDVEGALADAQHLEAAASGSQARHEICEQTARAILEQGFPREAGVLFERALRYLPDNPEATSGLGRAFVALGKPDRALALFERSLQLSERSGSFDPEAAIELALLLAKDFDDLPAAIARVRRVPASAARALEARGLEARWRAALGDIAGASLAWAKLREAMEATEPPPVHQVGFLVEAARFEREVELDPASAERHLALALALRPRDPDIQRAYREAAGVLAEKRRRLSEPEPRVSDRRAIESVEAELPLLRAEPEETEPPDGELIPEFDSEATRPGPDDEGEVDSPSPTVAVQEAPRAKFSFDEPTGSGEANCPAEDEAELESQVQRMESALRADPDNSAAALKLAEALQRLGRDPELFALVSARMEDADEPERQALLPTALGVLDRLEAQARAQSRPGEASLYADLRARFGAG